jgi:hypothetical protein
MKDLREIEFPERAERPLFSILRDLYNSMHEVEYSRSLVERQLH